LLVSELCFGQVDMVAEVSRREQKKELTRQALLCAASQLFADKGYDETTIDDIVNQADVAKVTFYYYFKSKEELVLAIKTSITDQTVDVAEALLTTSTSAETVVRALALEMASWVENHRPLFEVFFQQRFSPLMTGKQPKQASTRTAGNTATEESMISVDNNIIIPTGLPRGSSSASTPDCARGSLSDSLSDSLSGSQPGSLPGSLPGSAPGSLARSRPLSPPGPPPRLLNLAENIVIKGQKTGEFRPDFNSRELGHFILSNLMHEQFMWMSGDCNETLATRMDKRIDLMLGGLSTASESRENP
jgi:AcrR family transcriptional regulator